MKTKNFSESEFACKCCGATKPNSELMAVLQMVRSHFNAAVTITSSYRCDKHNAAVGGAAKSKHLEGIAADIQVKGVHPADVYHFLNSNFPNSYGLGSYNTFTHIDVRTTKARW